MQAPPHSTFRSGAGGHGRNLPAISHPPPLVCVEMLSLGNWGPGGRLYPLDLPKIIQSICPPAQHILALCQLGHQVFEVVLGFCQGPLVREMAGDTIGVPSPWVQSSILHQLPLTLEEKGSGFYSLLQERGEGKAATMHITCTVPDALVISLDSRDNLRCCHCYSHFTGQETEVWQGEVTLGSEAEPRSITR